ncbi:MAG: alpha/beta hydrolase [Ilumatobacteraceae bacterium]
MVTTTSDDHEGGASTGGVLSEQDIEIIEATIDAISSAMPIGLSPNQVASAGTRLARTVISQPLTMVRHALGFGAEQVKIVLGASDVVPNAKDRRFGDDWFTDRPIYRRLAQAQVSTERAIADLITDLDMDEKSRLRSELVAALITSAVAPTNTLLGNPAALKEAARTRGRSLVDGVRHAVHDARSNGGMPSMVDTRPFTPGDTVAATPGAVVFRNPVIELIQYTPTTTKVFKRPIFIVPPQINRFYVLDLAPGRSLVEHLVGEGHQVFLVSWRNPRPEHRDWNLDTYLAALIDASDATLSITGSTDLNLLGVCAGGITTAALLGHLVAIGDERVHSSSFLVTILDWSVPSTMGTMMSGPVIRAARRASQSKGILDGDSLGKVFAWLRPNDLVWNYWVNNYLLGQNPPAFDVLAWNVDSTNLPAELHADFLDMASENSMTVPGAVIALDTPVDLGAVTCDSFVVGAVTDHITPWKACFETVNLLGGDAEFVLSSQGHIQALVNPSGNPKGQYRVNADAIGTPMTPDAWEAGAELRQGSWWDHWTAWLKPRSGSRVNAPKHLGNTEHPVIVEAPGTYVLQ